MRPHLSNDIRDRLAHLSKASQRAAQTATGPIQRTPLRCNNNATLPRWNQRMLREVIKTAASADGS